jgi:hypothetical protein
VEQRVGVELHAAHHEEHGDEEAEADRLEPGLHGGRLVVVKAMRTMSPAAKAPSRTSRLSDAATSCQAGDEQQDDPDRQLARGAEVALHRLDDAGRLGP